MDWAWLWWIGIALLLFVVEMLTLDLLFVMLGASALVAAVAAAFGLNVPVQIVVFALVALVLLMAVRPIALRHLRGRLGKEVTNIDAHIGRPAVVVQEVSAGGGRVKLSGEVWSARSDDDVEVLPVGEEVRVVRIDGATAIVSRG